MQLTDDKSAFWIHIIHFNLIGMNLLKAHLVEHAKKVGYLFNFAIDSNLHPPHPCRSSNTRCIFTMEFCVKIWPTSSDVHDLDYSTQSYPSRHARKKGSNTIQITCVSKVLTQYKHTVTCHLHAHSRAHMHTHTNTPHSHARTHAHTHACNTHTQTHKPGTKHNVHSPDWLK